MLMRRTSNARKHCGARVRVGLRLRRDLATAVLRADLSKTPCGLRHIRCPDRRRDDTNTVLADDHRLGVLIVNHTRAHINEQLRVIRHFPIQNTQLMYKETSFTSLLPI